jgi:hypothetical protein
MTTLSPRHVQPWLLPLLTALAFATVGRAQCTNQWRAGAPLGGTDFTVAVIAEWDPDGAGPRTPLVVLGGEFVVAGSAAANRIVAYDPVTASWSTLGTGMNARVDALAVLPGGDLVAGGSFTNAGGVAVNRIARWDGSAWSPLGGGVDNDVRALAVLPSGDLIAGGWFNNASGAGASRVARWNGVSWSPLGSGVSGGPVLTLAALPNGDVVAGGSFTNAGGVAAQRVARWNGTTWSPLGSGLFGTVLSLVPLANGDVVAGGTIQLALGVPVGNIARWNGASWLPIGGGLSAGAEEVVALPNGDLIAVGADIEQWNGTAWASIGATSGIARAAALLASGELVIGGNFQEVDGGRSDNVARWNGVTWSTLQPGVRPMSGYLVTGATNGDVVAVDSGVGWPTADTVHQWDGVAWTQLGPPVGRLGALITAPSGKLLAANWNQVIVWDGTTWQPLGPGMDSEVTALLRLPNGDVIAGGIFSMAGSAWTPRVARWDGTAWSAMGAGLVGEVRALALAPNGDVIAGGSVLPGVRVARWNGTAWSPVGAVNAAVNTVTVRADGEIWAGGTGDPLRWNGVGWFAAPGLSSATGQVQVYSLLALPNGDVVATGAFTSAGGAPAAGIARWNGTTWIPLAASRAGNPRGLALLANGDVAVGNVNRLDDVVSAGFARLTTSCPAAVVASGAGCAGAGGPDVLASADLPWAGSTFRAFGTGLPANALALDVLGLSTLAIPLPALLPQGLAGCSLLVAPDLVTGLVPVAGTVQTQFAIPATPALAGQLVHEQVLTLELAAGGALLALTGSNRLTLTIGVF